VKDPTRRSARRDLLPTLAILLGVWLLFWVAQGIPTLCALANPCPAPDVRVAPAILFGALMLVPALVLIIAGLANRGLPGALRVTCYVVLVTLAIVGAGAVLFSGGFSLSAQHLHG
jgi:hypothetical protein